MAKSALLIDPRYHCVDWVLTIGSRFCQCFVLYIILPFSLFEFLLITTSHDTAIDIPDSTSDPARFIRQ